LTRLVNLLGVDLSDDLIPARPDNPKGFWEHRKIVELHDELLDGIGSSFDDFLPLPGGWLESEKASDIRRRLVEVIQTDFGNSPLWGFKDPRTCRLLRMWDGVWRDVGAEGRFAILLRNPAEIAQSLFRRDGMALNKSLLLTLRYLLDAERNTRSGRRALVSYDQLLADWRGTIARIGEELNVVWRKTAGEIEADVAGFLDSSMRHHTADDDWVATLHKEGADEQILNWIAQAHKIMRNSGAIDSGGLDRISAELESNSPRLTGWRDFPSPNRRVMQLEEWSRKLEKERDELRRGIEYLKSQLDERNAAYAKLETWTNELDAGKQWLQDDREKVLAELERYKEQCQSLEKWCAEIDAHRLKLLAEKQAMEKASQPIEPDGR